MVAAEDTGGARDDEGANEVDEGRHHGDDEDTGCPNDDPDDGPKVAVHTEAALQQRLVPGFAVHTSRSLKPWRSRAGRGCVTCTIPVRTERASCCVGGGEDHGILYFNSLSTHTHLHTHTHTHTLGG